MRMMVIMVAKATKRPYPIPANAPIEGNGQGDSHVIVVDKDNKMLYELYNASLNSGQWMTKHRAGTDFQP